MSHGTRDDIDDMSTEEDQEYMESMSEDCERCEGSGWVLVGNDYEDTFPERCNMCSPDIAAVDELPAPTAPVLSFIVAQQVAAAATQKGLDRVASGKHEQALAAVSKVAEGLAPPPCISDSPEGWTRQGALEGIIDAWSGNTTPRELDGATVADQELYCAAYMLTASVVVRVWTAAMRAERGAN